MKSKYTIFDRSRLRLQALAERKHDMEIGDLLTVDDPVGQWWHQDLTTISERINNARDRGAARILMMGAHVIKTGVSRIIIDLLNRGVFTHLAMNGAGAIHDYELARIGATTESVARYIRSGEFGLWKETGVLNEWAREAAELELGFGENVGRRILKSGYPNLDASLFATAYEQSIPATVHVGLGYDIVHEHPNCDGAAVGKSSYRDFLLFTRAVENLEGGILLNFGSAIMGPEVFLKALAMARNVAHQQDRTIKNFTTAVFDMVPIQGDYRKELPKKDPGYYFRPHKTMLVRTVADGGNSFYFCGDHRTVWPVFRRAILEEGSS